MSGSKNCGTFTELNTMQQKEGAPKICDSMEFPHKTKDGTAF